MRCVFARTIAMAGTAIGVVTLSAGGAGACRRSRSRPANPVQAAIGGFGPQLTPFGREFKLRGYTLRVAKNIPVSVMAEASYVRTEKDQPSPPAPHYGVNDNVTIDQVGLFIAGGLGDHLGAFIQNTYDGVAGARLHLG